MVSEETVAERSEFRLVSEFEPKGDQPKAIEGLVRRRQAPAAKQVFIDERLPVRLFNDASGQGGNTSMKTQTLIREIKSLPPDAQQEVADFVSFLRSRRVNLPRSARRRGSIMDERFFGLWRDRKDIADSAAYVRELRQRHMRG